MRPTSPQWRILNVKPGNGLVFGGAGGAMKTHTVGTENRGVKRKMGNEGC